MPTGFKDATGSTSIVMMVMAALAWMLVPFVHPVYGALVPPVLLAGAVLALVRHRRVEHPSLRDPQERRD